MKIVVLADAQNRGKSAAIKCVAEVFACKPGYTVIDRTKAAQIDWNITVRSSAGILIAFCSGGDYLDMIDDNIEYAQKHKCDILVSAARSKGAGFNRIAQFMQKKGNAGLIIKAIDFYKEGNFLSDNKNNHAAITQLTVRHLMRVIEYVM